MLLEGLAYLILAFGPLAFGGVEDWARGILRVLIFVGLIFILQKRDGPRPSWLILGPPLGLAVLGLLQGLNPRSMVIPSSWLPSTVSGEATGQAILDWAACSAWVVLLSSVLNSREALRRAAWAVFLVGAAIAVIGVCQLGQKTLYYYGLRPMYHGNVFGPFTNRNHAASLMGMGVLIGAGLLAAGVAKLRRTSGLAGRSDHLGYASLVGFLLGVTVFGMARTESRGGIVALLAAGAGVAVLSVIELASGRRRRLWVYSIGVSVAGGAAVLWQVPRFHSMFSDGSLAARFGMYGGALRMLADAPMFGVGLGAVEFAFPYYYVSPEGYVQHLHSDWVELAVQVGLVGFIGVGVSLGIFLWGRMSTCARSLSRQKCWVMAGFLAGALSFILHCAVEFPSQMPANMLMFIFILTWLAQADSWEAGESVRRQDLFLSRRGTRVAAQALCALGVVLSLRDIPGGYYSFAANHCEKSSRAFYLSSAVWWRPTSSLQLRLGAHYLDLAGAMPACAPAVLPRALWHAESCLLECPLDTRCLDVSGAILNLLGRVRDGAELAGRSQRILEP